MAECRIPRSLYKFDPYFGILWTYLKEVLPILDITRGEHIGMKPSEVTEVGTRYAKWRSGDPLHPGVYELHILQNNKRGGKRASVLEAQQAFIAFFTPILTRISANDILSDENRKVLNIAIPKHKYTHPTTPISESVYIRHQLMGNGRIQLKCYTASSELRARLPKGANSIQIAYRKDLIELEIDPETHLSIPGKVKRNMIKNVDDGTTRVSFTTASPLWILEGVNAGDFLQFYVRWYNHRHPNLAGPWSGPWAIPLH